MTKHKHADLIHAWADGAKIEFFSPVREIWELANEPSWLNNIEYRIKKEPVIEVVYYFQQFNFDDYHAFDCEPKLKKWDLKITYQDGKAIKAELSE